MNEKKANTIKKIKPAADAILKFMDKQHLDPIDALSLISTILVRMLLSVGCTPEMASEIFDKIKDEYLNFKQRVDAGEDF